MTNQVNILPMIALRGTTVLPDMIVHFDVSREKSIRAVEAAMLHDQKIFLLTQKDPEVEIPELTDLYQVGTVAYIKQVVKLPQDLYRVLVEGLDRAEVLGLEQEEPYLKAECEIVTAQEEDYPEPVKDAMLRSIRELFQRYCRAVNLPMAYQNKQKLLEAVSLNDRYEILGALLGSEIEVIHITKDLQRKVKSHIDKNQREYILREQMETIRDEYDYIILDTPPALSVLTINAYTASDELVIPMLCEILSLQGIAQLKQTIFAVQRYYNKELKVAGILLNKYNPRLTLTKDVEDLANVIAMQLDTKIFKSRISASVSIAEAPAHGESVITYSPKSKAAQEYFAFICELTGEKAGDKS